jgi:hypothetical protein
MTYAPYNQDPRAFDGRFMASPACSHDCMSGEDELGQGALPIGSFREAEVSGLLELPHRNDPADFNLVPWMNLPRRAWHRNEPAHLFRQ